MSEILCRICLRSDIVRFVNIDANLIEFHYELCETKAIENPALKFCPICEQQLKKFYNFRQKCRRANKVLKTWSLANVPASLENLQEMFPPSITFQDKNAVPKVIELTHADVEDANAVVKLEKEDNADKSKHNILDVLTTKSGKEQESPKINDVLDCGNESNNYENVVFKVEDENYYCEVDIFNDDCDDNDVIYEPKGKKSKSKITKHTKTRKKTSKISSFYEVDKKRIKKESLKDVSDKVTPKRKQFIQNQSNLKERILKLLKSGEFQDLGENVTMNEKVFLKMFEKCDKTGLRSLLPLKPGSLKELQKLRKFLLYLLKRNNPEYDDIFHVELLDTDAKKLDEFNRRKLSKEYIEAELKCERCYKVFEVQRLLDYHNRWHEINTMSAETSVIDDEPEESLHEDPLEMPMQYLPKMVPRRNKPSTGGHVCDMCAMRFASRKALAQHDKTNHCCVYRCRLCPLLTYNSAVMINHYNQHKGMEYSCPVCLSVFSNKNTLNNHRRQAHKTSHICSLCARSFVSEKGLYFHKRLKHKDEMETKSEYAVSCDKCDAVLTSPEVLLTHIRQVHESAETHKCFHCKEIFATIEELKTHKLDQDHQRPPKPLTKPSEANNKTDISQSDEEKPTCGECDRSFNSRKSYLRHVNMTHKINRIHKCGFCQAKFTSAEELESHRTALSHHRKVRYVKKQRNKPSADKRLKCNDPEKPFEKCQLCDELISTARTNTMYQHFQAAHPDTPYASVYSQPHNRHLCEQCGKTFKDLTFFIDHANLHSGAKPYACTLCPRSYSTRRHLRLHAERHGPPRHQCRDCGKMFNSAGNLFAHRRGHIGDRRFKCEICAKGFLHQAALNEHVRGVHNHMRRARKCRDK